MNMMDKIVVSRDSLEIIQMKLKGIKVVAEDIEIRIKIDEVLELLEKELTIPDISIEEIIQEKMDETRLSNPELNFKLYMLYRKLADGKINEEEAQKAFEIYLYYDE